MIEVISRPIAWRARIGGVATEAGTGDADDDILETVRHGVAGGVLGDDLGGVGGGLARTAEVALAGAGPGDDRRPCGR